MYRRVLRPVLARGAIIAMLFILGGAPPVLSTSGDILVLRAERARLYEAPDTAARVIMDIERGRKLMEFERRGPWVRVGVFGTLGQEAWLPAAALGPKEAPLAAEKPPEAGVSGQGTPEEPAFRLIIAGSPAMKFAAECQLVGDSGKTRRKTVRGLVPAQYTFHATALLCRVRKRDSRGRLRVELLRHGQRVASAETAAAFNHVRVQSAGPWGAAAGIRGAIPTRSLELSGRAPRDLVPRLPGEIVPRLPGEIVPPLTGTGSSRGSRGGGAVNSR